MNKRGSADKIKLSSFDDLFGTQEASTGTEQVQEIPLCELHEFRGHPFKVLDDEKMQETVESIKNYGVLMPGIARPRAEGGYEIIAGHRRRHGCELAGLSTMPMFVRDYTDDEATIIMVDTNIQREDILPSEKARAYSMKYEAMKHQGKKGAGNSLDEVGEAAGESGKTVQRYIWLSRLSDELLEMVDKKKIGLVQGVDISFLTEQAQEWVQVILEETGAAISTTQSSKLKEYGKSGELTLAMVRLILTEEKAGVLQDLVKKGKTDLAFMYQTDPELECHMIAENLVYIQVPPAFTEGKTGWKPGKQNPQIEAQMLQNQSLILLKKGRGMRAIAEQFLKQFSITPARVFETENIHLASRLAALNRGFTFIPGIAVSPLMQDGQNGYYCQVKDYPMKRSLYCCYRGQSYQTEAERYLISLIQKTGL